MRVEPWRAVHTRWIARGRMRKEEKKWQPLTDSRKLGAGGKAEKYRLCGASLAGWRRSGLEKLVGRKDRDSSFLGWLVRCGRGDGSRDGSDEISRKKDGFSLVASAVLGDACLVPALWLAGWWGEGRLVFCRYRNLFFENSGLKMHVSHGRKLVAIYHTCLAPARNRWLGL